MFLWNFVGGLMWQSEMTFQTMIKKWQKCKLYTNFLYYSCDEDLNLVSTNIKDSQLKPAWQKISAWT